MLLAVAIYARPPFFNQPSAGALSEHLDAAGHSVKSAPGRASASVAQHQQADIVAGMSPTTNRLAVRKGTDPSVQSDADAAVRKAMKGPWPVLGQLETLVDAIHANADSASLEVLDEARALRAKLREEMREAKTPTLSASPATAADAALHKATQGGELEGLMDAIHANADAASPDVLEKARAVRDELRDGKAVKKAEAPTTPASPASAADAALRKAIEAGTLEGLMDAIHANANTASPAVVEEARALRDKLRDGKHAAPAESGPEKKAPPAVSGADKATGASEKKAPPAASGADGICAKPESWCAHVGATNEPTECGGLPGHFCQDIYGKSGFWPCDESIAPTWGKVGTETEVVCEAGHGDKSARSGAHDLTGASKISKWASEDLLSEAFFNAQPKKHLADVGITIHCFDDTESIMQGGNQTVPEPWRPCSPGDACPAINFGKWWSTSIINWAQRNTFGDHGIILAPDKTSVLCSYPADGGTMTGGCAMGHPDVDRFDGEDMSPMMSMSMFWQKLGYNEVLINSKDFNAHLPGSVAAFVFNLKGQGKEGITYYRYQAFLTHFNLKDTDVPLLKANTPTWRTQKKQYTNPFACGMQEGVVAQNQQQRQAAYAAWANGDCPPKDLVNRSAGSTAMEVPLFTDMTKHAREYLRKNRAPPMPEQPVWQMGQAYRVGANREVSPDLERLRSMDSFQRANEMQRLQTPGLQGVVR